MPGDGNARAGAGIEDFRFLGQRRSKRLHLQQVVEAAALFGVRITDAVVAGLDYLEGLIVGTFPHNGVMIMHCDGSSKW